MTPIRFGAVPVSIVRQALEGDQVFRVTKCDGSQSNCKISGTFEEWEGYHQDTIQQLARSTGLTNADYSQPLQLYNLGFRYFDDPAYAGSDGPSHGMVLVQNDQVLNLDLVG